MHKCLTGRISALGLDSTDQAYQGQYKKTQRADILPERSMVNKRLPMSSIMDLAGIIPDGALSHT